MVSKSRRPVTRVMRGVGALAAAIAGVLVLSGSLYADTHSARPAHASQPTVYMVGSVTNNTFWAAVKNGFEQGGRDFGLRAIYNAPDVHSSAGSIPLINAALGA